MPTAASLTAIQKVYIAYYGRPADPIGLDYWATRLDTANGNLSTIINAFGTSAEATTRFAGQTTATMINNLYLQMFNRAAEPAGLSWWVQQVTSGNYTVATVMLAVLAGAQGADATAIAGKLASADLYTNAMDTTAEILAYQGTAAADAGRAFLATYGATTATAAQADAAVATMVAGSVPPPVNQTFALTTGLDAIVGGAGNDTINGLIGAGATLTVLDSVDGGAGTDTMNITDMTGGTALPAGLTVKNVEVLNVVSVGAATIDTSTGFTGLTNVNVTKSTGAETITAGTGQAVSVVNSAGTVTVVGGTTQTVTTAGGVILSKATGAVTVTDTAQAGVASTIDDGTSVNLTTTTTGTGTIAIGATTAPTGAITVVENLKGTGALAGGAIGVKGGTTVDITVNASQATNGVATTVGAITALGTANTTAVTVAQTKAVTAVATTAAVAAVTETSSAVFAALTAGQSLTAGGLTFTAGAAGTTAAQTAAAFANLTAGTTQGNSTLGIYSGTLAGWTSGAVSTATVLFTSTAAGNVADLAFVAGGGATLPTLTPTQGVAAVAAAGIGGITNSAVTIQDVNYLSATKAGTITTATISNYTTATINDNALTTLSLTNGSGNIIIDNSGLASPTNKTLALTLNGVTGGTLDDADIYTTLNITTATANSTLANITDTALTALTVAGTNSLTLTSTAGMTALKTVTVSGSAGLTGTFAQASQTAFDASATSGAMTITMDATKATYSGGSGVDKLTLSATNPTKAIALGAGNDFITLATGTTTVNGGITGGDGTDTITMDAADAVTFSGASTFAAKVTGFEILGLTGGTGAQSVAIDTLGNFNSVTTGGEAAGGVLTMTGFTSDGTLTLTSASTGGYVVSGTAWAAGTADSFNFALSKTGATAFGSVTAANVETINISDNGTAGDAHSLTLVATSAKTINVTGNATLTLTTAGNTKVTAIDASGMTGAIAVAAAGTVATTITGGAGADTLSAFVGGTTADILIGGAGADTLIANKGLNTLTGGAGNDLFVIAAAGANVNTYSTITDATAGDRIQLANLGTEVFTVTKLALAPTAVFQDYANAVVNAGGNASVDAQIGWFQYSGDTYIIQSLHNAVATPNFTNGTDIVVKLTGLVDLSTASLNSGATPTLLLA